MPYFHAKPPIRKSPGRRSGILQPPARYIACVACDISASIVCLFNRKSFAYALRELQPLNGVRRRMLGNSKKMKNKQMCWIRAPSSTAKSTANLLIFTLRCPVALVSHTYWMANATFCRRRTSSSTRHRVEHAPERHTHTRDGSDKCKECRLSSFGERDGYAVRAAKLASLQFHY